MASLEEELFGDFDDAEAQQESQPTSTQTATAQSSTAPDLKELFGDDEEDEAAVPKSTASGVAAILEEGEDELAKEQVMREKEERKKEKEEKQREQEAKSESENEEDALKIKEERRAARQVKAEGNMATVQTTVAPTFDNDATLLLVKLPNVVGINSRPFDPSTHVLEETFEEKAAAASGAFTAPVRSKSATKKEKEKKRRGSDDAMDVDDDDEDETGNVDVDEENADENKAPIKLENDQAVVDKKVHINPENYIRWRTKTDANGAVTRESNARLVRFSDGSQFLYLGEEVFQVSIDPRQQAKNYCIQNLNNFSSTKKAVGKFEGLLKFRVLGIHSRTHQKLKQAVQLTHVQKPKIQRRYDTIASKDMEETNKAILALEKQDEANRRKRERQIERERMKRGDRGDRERARYREQRDKIFGKAGDYDDEDDEEEEAFARSSSAHKRKRVDESSDEEEARRLEKAKRSYDDDDDDDEEMADEDEEEESSKKKKKKKSKEEEEEAAEDDEEDIVVRKSGSSKRRKLEDDEDEDDE